MRRFTLLFWAAFPLYAAEHSGAEKDMTGYLWANFFILILALGWLVRKYGSPFLAARTEAIQQGIADAGQRKAEADRRIAEVQAKLAALEPEIDRMKVEMRVEQAREVDRVRARNAAEIEHIHDRARQEVESDFKAARLLLEEHAGKLALGLAETKIRARMNPDAQRKLTREFVSSLS